MTEGTRRATWRSWIIGVLTGLVALAALVSGSAFGKVTTKSLNPRLIAWISAAVLLVFGTVAVTRISKLLAHHVSVTSLPSAGGAVRILSAGLGYLIVIFGVLAELKVPIDRLLVGAGLAGIVLGIAAQQSLGNVFAGLILVLAKPFRVGDRVRIRSGSLGGIFDARVREMTLTYVTLEAEEGYWKIPNSAMLAAGVLRTPRTPLPPPAASTAPPPAKSAAPAQDGTQAQDGTPTHDGTPEPAAPSSPAPAGPSSPAPAAPFAGGTGAGGTGAGGPTPLL